MGVGKRRGFFALVWTFLLLLGGCYGSIETFRYQRQQYDHLLKMLEDKLKSSKEKGDLKSQLLLLNEIAEIYTVEYPSLRYPSPMRGFAYNQEAKEVSRKIKKIKEIGLENLEPSASPLSPERLAQIGKQIEDRSRRLSLLIRRRSGVGAVGIGFGGIPAVGGVGGVGGGCP